MHDVLSTIKLSLLIYHIVILFYNLIVNGCFANSLKNLKIMSLAHEHEAGATHIEHGKSGVRVVNSVDFIVNV